MRQESFWGGGPEVVALCNLLKRPIHIYELYPYRKTNHEEFRLRRMACFGSPKFDQKEALHILSADSRFPDVAPGKQLAAGNHFLAVFPETATTTKNKEKRKRIRGGGASPHWIRLPFTTHGGQDDIAPGNAGTNRGGMIEADGRLPSWLVSWWSLFICALVWHGDSS